MKGLLTLLMIGLGGFFAWDYYSFTTDPNSDLGLKRAQIEQKKIEITTNEKKVADAKSFYGNLERKRDELRALSSELATMKSTLTETPDPPAFMKLVLTEAKRVGLTVTGLVPMVKKAEPFYIEQPFDLTFQGVYLQIIAFLDRISQAERIVRVDDFSIRPRLVGSVAKSTRYVELEGTIKIRSYVYVGTQEDDLAKRGGSDPGATPAGGKQ